MRWVRWIVGLGALGLAVVALYVLLGTQQETPPVRSEPAMDEIDAESREAMRELLREAGEE
ncbi:MAG: hypothetical protein JRF61_25940 [Deltaproteobacteria bacterium]|jgi:hypothetical protein|nr:hypothetical protein [Deltaproteobacteria bacterium]